MNNEKEILNALLRTDFYSYIQKVFSEVTGGEVFIPSWHLQLICDTLEKCRRGEIKRLIINVPPRSLKSIIVNVGLTSWLLGHTPSEKIISASYSSDLSEKFARDTKRVMESSWYQKLFPRTRLAKDRRSASDFNTTKRGCRFATSVEGTLTGRGGNWIIIDDPIKPGDIMNENALNKVNNWYQNTLLSRLDNKNDGVIIVIMQRVHEDDLSGYLLDGPEEWHHLKIPAVAEEDEKWNLSNGNQIIRKKGAVINSKQLSKQLLLSYKTQMGSYVFAGQYQQSPAPMEGGIIKKSWFNKFDINNPPKFHTIIQSWDTANKTGEIHAFSACSIFGLTKNNQYYLLEVIRKRLEMPDLVKKVTEVHDMYKKKYEFSEDRLEVLIEDKASGTGLLQILKKSYRYIKTVSIKPDNDKVTRLKNISVKVEGGMVYVPHIEQRWWSDFENELLRFPKSKYADQVDSFSQALNYEKMDRSEIMEIFASG